MTASFPSYSSGRFDDVLQRHQRLRDDFVRVSSHVETLTKQKIQTESRLETLKEELQTIELCLEFFKHLVDEEVTKDVNAVRDLQIEGLSAVFHDRDLKVRAEVDEVRGRVSVNFLTVSTSGGVEVAGKVDSSFGGSVAVIQGILFRVSMIFRRSMRPVLILDETLRFVEKHYADRAVGLLQTLADKMGLDILLITHDEDVVSAAKRVYRISYLDGKAKFRQVK